MSEQQKKISIVIGLVAFVTLVVALYWYYGGSRLPLELENGELGGSEATTTGAEFSGNLEAETSSGEKIVGVDVSKLPPAPDVDRKVNYSSSLTPDVQKIYADKISLLAADIKTNPYSLESWIGIGVYYKQVGDYQAARDAWEYSSLISPGNIISFNNLGDLYHYYLQDYPKAEQNFLRAIQNDPKYALSYVNLHDLYRFSYGVLTTKAADILKQGIRENPENIDLYVTLATYYKNLNNKIDKENARVYYEKALDLARKVGNKQLVDLLSAELEALK